MRVALALCLLAGCDFIFRIDRISSTPQDDAAVTGDTPGPDDDGMVAPDVPQSTACDVGSVMQVLVGPFSTPSLGPNKLQLFASRMDTDSQSDIYVSTRSSVSATWSGAQLVTELSTAGEESEPNVYAQGTRILYVSNRLNGRLLYQASRATVAESFSISTVISTSSNNYDGFDVSPDGLTLYADDGLDNALRKATRTDPNGGFGGFGTIYNGVGSPSLTGNGLVVYYHRLGVIYRATRGSLVGGFSGEQMVTAGEDPDISEDGTLLVYKNAAGLASIPCSP